MQTEATVSQPPRRTKVKDRRGIYFRVGADGKRRYEITFRDSRGKQRWKVVPGGLKDAEVALEEVRGKLRRGERVSPTKATFEEVAKLWFATQSELRPYTRDTYDCALRTHLLPRFGRMKIAQLTEDDVALLVAEMRTAGKSGWTIRGALTPLGRIFGYAVRRGLIGANPMARLERGERPSVGRRDMRILDRDEIGKVLAAADDEHRTLLATAIFTGLRHGELLGLTWSNVDLEGGSVKVRRQLTRSGRREEPKTPQAVRDVPLSPLLGSELRKHRLRSRFTRDEDLVFPSAAGQGMDQSVSRRALAKAVKAAGLDGGDRSPLRFHDLRHTFASLSIAGGQSVVSVANQLGHSSPDLTLKVYSHLFDAEEHAERARNTLDQAFTAAGAGNALERAGGNAPQDDGPPEGQNVAQLHATGTSGNA